MIYPVKNTMHNFIRIKTAYTILAFLFLVFTTHAQTPTIEWQLSIGDTSEDVAKSIKPTTDGGYIVAGTSSYYYSDTFVSYGYSKMSVVKLSAEGNIQWKKFLGESAGAAGNSIQQTTDGGYIVLGTSTSTDTTQNQGSSDYWVVKLDATGNIQWQQFLGGSGQERAEAIVQTIDGGYIIAGASYSSDGDVTVNYGSPDYWVVKLDAAGALQWQKSYGGSGFDWAYDIQQTTDGGYIVAGSSMSSDSMVTGHHAGAEIGLSGNFDMWILKLDSVGSIQWERSLGGSKSEHGDLAIQTSDGMFVVAGSAKSDDGDVTVNAGNTDCWIVKLNTVGDIVWQRTYGGSEADDITGLRQTDNGGYIVVGNTGTTKDYSIGWFDGSANMQWQMFIGGGSPDYVHAVEPTTDGGYIVAGSSTSNDGDVTVNYGAHDMWIVKLSAPSCQTSFALMQDSVPHNWVAINNSTGVAPLTYNWNWGDGTTSSGPTPSHTYTTAAHYYICLSITDATGCTSTYCDSSTFIYKAEQAITVNAVLAVSIDDDISSDASVSVYPNPALDQLNIANAKAGSNIYIYNTQGKLMRSLQMQSEQQTFNIAELTAGIYYIEVNTNSTTVRRKLIKL